MVLLRILRSTDWLFTLFNLFVRMINNLCNQFNWFHSFQDICQTVSLDLESRFSNQHSVSSVEEMIDRTRLLRGLLQSAASYSSPRSRLSSQGYARWALCSLIIWMMILCQQVFIKHLCQKHISCHEDIVHGEYAKLINTRIDKAHIDLAEEQDCHDRHECPVCRILTSQARWQWRKVMD